MSVLNRLKQKPAGKRRPPSGVAVNVAITVFVKPYVHVISDIGVDHDDTSTGIQALRSMLITSSNNLPIKNNIYHGPATGKTAIVHVKT